MRPKVSVVVPVYNAGALLPRCLDSLVNQTLENIEIICVNDGSTDGSREILEKYSTEDRRVIVLHQENLGQGAARNAGMDAASGEYLGFVDADDWIELDYFEKLHRAAKKYGAEMACCGIIRKYPSSRTRKKLVLAEEKLYSLTLEKYKITETPRKCYVYNKIYRRSEIERHRLRFPEGVFFEDIAFTIRAIYYLKTLVTVPGAVYFYWVNYKSTTRDMGDKKQQDLLAAREDFIKFSRQHHINCDENHYIRRKITYKFLGLPLMKIYHWETVKKYYLFALIPIFERRVSL
ncbi:MAG: glycosyltransferase [Holosporaceae bacterium]|jgi:glycosyltransferase EpsH|nr:glycosyltransferase [Holosporaceae bacterium]